MEYLTFGRALQRRRCALLSNISTARAVLILGDGDGRFTAELLRQNTTALVDSVDCSKSMVRIAAARIARSPNGRSRVRQVLADVQAMPLIGSYDLVVSHFFLDCFTTEELDQLIPRISAHVNPGGRWLISEFQIPSTGLRRYLATVVVKALYMSFAVVTGLRTKRLPNYREILIENGYVRTALKPGASGMLVSEIWEHA
jgi:ubiquinone/menaquinone biosynthesis C-methylase UbiE